MSKNPSKKKSIKVNKSRIYYLCFFFLLIALSLFNLSLSIFSRPKIVYSAYNPTQKKITFWQSFLEAHPTYFEGWIELSVLQLKSGDKEAARYAFVRARKINPNAEEIKNLSRELK